MPQVVRRFRPERLVTVQIEVISDVVCPWCFIGKRRLEEALRRLPAADPGIAVEVAWRPFQLNPDLPEDGVERSEYLRRKFGDASGPIYARVTAVETFFGDSRVQLEGPPADGGLPFK